MRTLDSKKVVDEITKFIKDYAHSARIKTLVVGVSGGIDSSVVSAICGKTELNVMLVGMPIGKGKVGGLGSIHAHELIQDNGNIHYTEINLTDSFNAQVKLLNESGVMDGNLFHSNIEESVNEDRYNLVLANMASRLRMLTLYAVSNMHQGLVVGTGNKIEDFGVGFFTRGGDGTVDISPIADLMKSEVYELGRTLGINREILESRPTDGLWEDGRTDEEQIGATYDELEWAMLFTERIVAKYGNNQHQIDIETEKLPERKRRVFYIYTSRHNINKFKMIEVPICKLDDTIKYID